MKLIEDANFTLTQQQAPDEATACFALAEMINELIKSTGIVISPYDIVIFAFSPANSGTDDNPTGFHGKFEFRVTPPESRVSAYSSGTITASPVGNEPVETHGRASLLSRMDRYITSV